jgi:large subunit ribosomal protein L19
MDKGKTLRDFEKSYAKKDVPKFKVGDSVDVHVKIIEEGKKRIQVFAGIVIKKQNTGAKQTFTVRKVSFAEGVERTFPIHSPNVDKVVVTRKGNVKRSKLYYLRKKVGRKTKIEGEDVYAEKTSSEPDAPREKGAKKGA